MFLLLLMPLLLIACGDEVTDTDTGLSRAQVVEIARSEMANIPAPADPGPSRAEVEQIVAAAIAGMPAPASASAPGLTQADVNAAIQAAISAMPDPGTEEPTSAKAEQTPLSVSPSTPAEYTKFFVDNAIDRYKSEGLDATLAYYNRAESVDGQWYVFIIDENDLIIAHPDPNRLGLDLKGSVGTDANGYNFGPEMLSAMEDGKWLSYVYENPTTGPIGSQSYGDLQLKNAWVVRHDGLLFGSGWYIDAEENTKSLVSAAVDKFREVGLERTMSYFMSPESVTAGLVAAIQYYNSAENITGRWSAFIADSNGKLVGHNNPTMVGRTLDDLFSIAASEATEAGNWVTTDSTNPATGLQRSVRIWLVAHGGYVFGSGWSYDESN